MRTFVTNGVRQEVVAGLNRARVLVSNLQRVGETPALFEEADVNGMLFELATVLSEMANLLSPALASEQHLEAARGYLVGGLHGPARFHLRHLATLLADEQRAWGVATPESSEAETKG